MKNPFDQLKASMDTYYANPTHDNKINAISKAFILLIKDGIMPRDAKKNKLIQFNLSIPSSKNGCIVFGLRYLKLTGRYLTNSEDHFLFEQSSPNIIKREKKKWLEKVFPEYKGEHKKSMWIDVIEEVEAVRKTGKETGNLMGAKIRNMQ